MVEVADLGNIRGVLKLPVCNDDNDDDDERLCVNVGGLLVCCLWKDSAGAGYKYKTPGPRVMSRCISDFVGKNVIVIWGGEAANAASEMDRGVQYILSLTDKQIKL